MSPTLQNRDEEGRKTSSQPIDALNAEGWLAAHPRVAGIAISMPEAIAAGRAVFGGILEER